ncbi:MAG: hypothetical protein J6W64_01500 [Bacilli bacterium]|nr:hypothetical protein [Bacilli bacterium]
MAEERQTNYTIAESYELPSKGQIYDVEVNPMIELRSMTARDEMKRLSPSATPFKTLADIIEGCMLEKPAVHVYDMAVGDYEYLLHKLRIISYGENYKIAVICPHCGEEVETTAKLNSLTLKEFDKDEFEKLRTFELPVSKKTITLKFQTPHILDIVENKAKEFKRKFKSAEINFELLSLLLTIIDTVDSEKLSDAALESFVNNLPVKDMTKIVNAYDRLNQSLGLDNTLTIQCPKCGEDILTFFRFGPEFFRPTDI